MRYCGFVIYYNKKCVKNGKIMKKSEKTLQFYFFAGKYI